ncbi:TPA: hypothetical protein ACGXMW_001680 [Bacillus paranthracis]
MNKNSLFKYCYISGGIVVLLSLFSLTILPKLMLIFLALGMCMFLIGFLFCTDRRLDIIFLLVLATECFYIPTGGVTAQDLFVLFTLLLILKMFLHRSKRTDGIYKFTIFLLIFLAFASSVNATSVFAQTYINSIFPLRHYLILLLFFVLVDWLERGYKIDKYLIITSFIALSLFTIQYLLYNKIQFLSIPHVSERLGEYRMHFQTLTPILGAMVAFNSFINREKGLFKWFSLLVYLTGLLFTVFINQTRTYMFGLILSAVLIYILSNTSLKNKLKVSLGVVLILIVLFPLYINPITEMVQSSYTEIQTDSGNYGVRQNAINYYLTLGKEHLIWGNGLINLKAGSLGMLPGYFKGYFWVDIGVYGLFFLHGLLGVFWYGWVLRMLLKDYKNSIKSNRVYIIGYAAFGVMTATTVGVFYFYLFPTIYCLAIHQFTQRENLDINLKEI